MPAAHTSGLRWLPRTKGWSARRSATSAVGALVASLGLGGLALVAPAAAHADLTPPPGVPATASAKALPTWQINGVGWNQVVVGNTVYVAGSFSAARPPGVAPGGAGEVSAQNIFAYDIRTGNRVTTFSHALNGQARGIAKTPDGTRIYVVGDFTAVDNQARAHVAGFDVATGALLSGFAPNVNGAVRAVTASNTTVYFGGVFSNVSGSSRGSLAAVDATSGAVRSWAPGADGTVWSMVLTPDGSRVVIGGQFSNLSGVPVYGHGAVSSTTGAIGTWLANQNIHDAVNGAIGSLTTDGTYIYGTGWAFGAGSSFEGTFAANPTDGSIHWVYDCLGDTYSAEALGGVLYSVGHSHDCTMIGEFPDTNPRVRWQHSLAFTTTAEGVNNGPDVYGWDYNGLPAPKLLHWFPTWSTGSYTGQYQAGWSISGNSSYVAVAGEFPYVNNQSQQGLVRFGIGAAADKTYGPTYTTNPPRPTPSTTAGTVRPGAVRVAFGSAWDKDNATLTYQVVRDGNTNIGAPIVQDSNFWTLPNLAINDTSVPPGSHTYRVKITDGNGNVLQSPVSNSVTVSNTIGAYGDAVVADNPADYWRLGEAGGNIGLDGGTLGHDVSLNTGMTLGTSGAVSGNTAATADGTDLGFASTTATQPGPDSFSVEGWFRTTTTTGGKLVGFGNNSAGQSGAYDRHVYMTNDGRLVYGVYTGNTVTLTTSTSYNDGQWHHFVGSLGSAGMSFYVDGLSQGKITSVTSGQPYDGYWRIGGDNLNGWPNQPASTFFKGDLDEVAVYGTPLTQNQIRAHYTASGRTVNIPPPPADSYGSKVYQSTPDLYWRLNESTGTVATDVMGTTPGNYSGGYSQGVSGPLAGNTAVAFNGVDGGVSSASPFTNPTVYSEELWFNTTTTSGGKLIGFGSSPTGNSGGYDRHVWMLNNGHLRFGTWTGQPNVAESSASYNDGAWHHMVATQGPAGMKLYVDGVLVGSNPQTQAQDYTGYWRIGGDTHWGDADSYYFNGRLDEVAIYSRALSLSEVQEHYAAGGGAVSNVPPVAAFTTTAAGLAISFDGTTSDDPDGSIDSYAWDFGDGQSGSGATTSHTYAGTGSYTVRLVVTDNRGATGTTTKTISPVAAPTDTYGKAVSQTAPDLYWRLGEASGTTAADAMGSNPGAYFGGVTYGAPGGVSGTTDTAVTFDGAGSGVGSTVAVTNPSTYSEELWFKTTTTAGGKLIGFGDQPSGTSSNYDRHVYMNSAGQLNFGVWTGQANVITSPSSYNDGAWHHVVAAQGSGGMVLYVDGAQVAAGPQNQAQPYTGYWRVGGDSSWADSNFFNGTIDEVAVYSKVLTSGQVQDHFAKGGGTVANTPPVASFDQNVTGRSVAFDASGSSDPDGTIASYSWKFGDGATGTGKTPDHTYATGGSYTVELTVTDDGGLTTTTSHAVPVPANQAPTAAFTVGANGLVASVDASTSSDPDGTIASYSWKFGDGATGSGKTTTHTYAAGGSYTVELTVTDDEGLTDTTSHPVTATANQAPTAAFTATSTDLVASLDASTSSDPDGTIASYSWKFGDGATGTGKTTTHTYAASGSYSVELTVTDNGGATNAVTKSVVVTGPLAKDNFARTLATGLGSADIGGPWTLTGAASTFAVDGTAGIWKNTAAGKGTGASLLGVSSTDTDLQLRMSFDKAPTGGGYYGYFAARGTVNDAYRTKVFVSSTGQVTLSLTKVVAGAETALASKVLTGVTYVAGDVYSIRTQAWGSNPTSLRAKMWLANTAEPTTWAVTATDATASLQTAKGVAVSSYLSGTATNVPVWMRVSALLARPTGN